MPGFLDNSEDFFKEAEEDSGADEWEAFLEAWHAELGGERYTSAQLAKTIKHAPTPGDVMYKDGLTGQKTPGTRMRETLPEELEPLVQSDGFATALGNALRRKIDTRFGEYRATKAGEKNRAKLWLVRRDVKQEGGR